MKQFSRKKIAALLKQAEKLAPTDPEAALAVKMFRSLLEPPKPRDLLREELQGKLGEYSASILMGVASENGKNRTLSVRGCWNPAVESREGYTQVLRHVPGRHATHQQFIGRYDLAVGH